MRNRSSAPLPTHAATVPRISGLMDSRLAALEHWLAGALDGAAYRLAPAFEDASFPRFFRAHLADGRPFIVVDAPPPQDNCGPFVRIAPLLLVDGLHSPAVP